MYLRRDSRGKDDARTIYVVLKDGIQHPLTELAVASSKRIGEIGRGGDVDEGRGSAGFTYSVFSSRIYPRVLHTRVRRRVVKPA